MSSRVSASLRSPPCLAQYALIVPNGVSAFDSGRPSRNSDVVCRAVAMFASVLDVAPALPQGISRYSAGLSRLARRAGTD